MREERLGVKKNEVKVVIHDQTKKRRNKNCSKTIMTHEECLKYHFLEGGVSPPPLNCTLFGHPEMTSTI